MRQAFLGYTTRSLLVCVVLGAFTAAVLHLARFIGMLLLAVAPWLGSPSALIPWFAFIIVAALLVQRPGAAVLTALIGTVAGVGAMSLMAGVVVEAVFLVGRAVRRRRRGAIAPVGDRAELWLAVTAGILTGGMSYATLFTIQEFLALPAGLIVLGLVVRIVAGILYGWLAFAVVRGLLRAGFDPGGPRRARRRESTTSPSAGSPR